MELIIGNRIDYDSSRYDIEIIKSWYKLAKRTLINGLNRN